MYFESEIGEHHPAQLSITTNGTIYFVSNVERKIYLSLLLNGEYTEPELMQYGVNDLDPIGHPAIAPDESYIIVDQVYMQNDTLKSNMYISFNNEDGTWTPPESIRDELQMSNSDVYAAPRITYDGKYLFFEKYYKETDKSDIYWVSTIALKEQKY